MAKKVRKDTKGRILHKGETYRKDKELYCYCYTDPLGKRHSLYSPDLGKLREKEKAVLRDRLDGLETYALARSDINYVFERYIYTKTELRGTTMTGYLYNYDRYVRDSFGRKRIAEIRYSDIIYFYNSLLKKGLTVSTVDRVHCLLHPTFQMAVRDNIIRNNPSDGALAEIKKKMEKSEPRHALDIDSERRFLSILEQPEYKRWKPLFVVMFGTGCRVGEVIGLTWKEVNFEKNYIRVDHSMNYTPLYNDRKCKFRIELPKTAAGIRNIPMLNKVREVLLEEKERQKATKSGCKVVIDGMTGFIFLNRYGMPFTPESINREIARIVDDYNTAEELKAVREKREPLLIPRFSCHVTRHTFCTRLCENETNVKVIQTVMGHKDIQTTLDIYAEVSEKKKQDVFEQLNNINII